MTQQDDRAKVTNWNERARGPSRVMKQLAPRKSGKTMTWRTRSGKAGELARGKASAIITFELPAPAQWILEVRTVKIIFSPPAHLVQPAHLITKLDFYQSRKVSLRPDSPPNESLSSVNTSSLYKLPPCKTTKWGIQMSAKRWDTLGSQIPKSCSGTNFTA